MSLGPPSGQDSSNPVSGELAVRAAPRNVGQLFSSKLSPADNLAPLMKARAINEHAKVQLLGRECMGKLQCERNEQAGTRPRLGAPIGRLAGSAAGIKASSPDCSASIFRLQSSLRGAR